jgi:hypothetical protein
MKKLLKEVAVAAMGALLLVPAVSYSEAPAAPPTGAAGASATGTATAATGQAPVRAPAVSSAKLVVDDYEGSEVKNKLDNRCNVFIKAPSKAMVSRRQENVEGRETNVLLIRYEKKNQGGPYDSGGWCGYYTLLKAPGALVAPTEDNPNPSPLDEQYLDGSDYKAVTFWVRGETGEENFVVGMSDRHWDRVGDSVKSQEVGKYLPKGKVTTEWQKATIPLDEFFIDYSQLAAISIVFEGDLFPDTGHSGTVYLDDLTLE